MSRRCKVPLVLPRLGPVLWLMAATAAQDHAAAGAERFAAGDFAGAAAAFRSAIEQRPEDAALQYNLALALWRGGDLLGAEEAAERYAAMPGGGRVDLHRGLLGLCRHGEAERLRERARTPAAAPAPGAAPGAAPQPPDPVALLEQALGQAQRARDEFVRAAKVPGASAALPRNLERTLRLIEDLQRELDAARQQRDEQRGQEPSSDSQQQESEPQQGDKPQPQDKPKEEGEQPQQGEPKPEPSPPPQQGQEPPGTAPPEAAEGQERPEPQAADAKSGQVEPVPRGDAPGEQAGDSELSPEQRQRLLDMLQQLDQRMRAYRAAGRSGRTPVERDW